MARRETELVAAFVRLADTLVDDYDPMDLVQYLLDRAVELLPPADNGAVLLVDEHGDLQVFASTDETARWLELLQLQSRNGPCLQSYRTAERVVTEDLQRDRERWPEFADTAYEQGLRSVYALPLRLRDDRLGAMNLFSTDTGAHLSDDDLAVGQALADIAAIALLRARQLADTRTVNNQLQHALQSRIVIEQAKGMLSAQGELHPETAFAALRGYARHHRRRLPELSREVVERSVDAAEVLAFAAAPAHER
ncbi:GAF and ANTAR domain-containing protein [Nocardia asteroides]|uniref:GAF and ANTAR domain-containing protein n=1 Tax=Nocardia asteroides TaxID=1824 RepID=UPI001E3463EA|nr:GAF and ANTAR domain-containing protein [Nocardia asteroides]UGT62096.1 GAF and ANTAR domain-containing protein [Nocardia asteroides]